MKLYFSLCSGIDLDANIIGYAPIGTMCKGSSSGALMQDTGTTIGRLGSLAAHEIGHVLNMLHDEGGRE